MGDYLWSMYIYIVLVVPTTIPNYHLEWLLYTGTVSHRALFTGAPYSFSTSVLQDFEKPGEYYINPIDTRP